ncbi:EAL domain-containing response regulator [Magnetococcales bacterium HHB-1]
MSEKHLIFIVDDDPEARLLLQHRLKKYGYQTRCAADGEEVLTLLDEALPDLILMDAQMPGMDGFAACEWIKKQRTTRHIPVLMITAFDDAASVDRAYTVGAADFITKPIHWSILRNRLKYLLQRIEAQQQLDLANKVYQHAHEGIVVTDYQGVIQSVNPAFIDITGYRADEAVGKNMRMLKSGRHDAEFYRKMWHTLIHVGCWTGEIWNRRKNGEIYPQLASFTAIRDRQNNLINFVAVFSDLTTLKESEANLHYITGHDSLTGLTNRPFFIEHLDRMLAVPQRRNRIIGVILFDLNRFKNINDTMGPDAGDQVLIQVSQRIQHVMPKKAILSRMSGDEFGVILPSVGSSQKVEKHARRILEELSQPFLIDQLKIFLSASMGIAIYPGDGIDAKNLLKNADTALNFAKEEGDHHFQFYRRDLNASALKRVLLESSLRSALDNGEFELYYQPQIDLISNRVIGVEALIRWHHPDQGMVSPGEFIPLAEETRLIIPMGQWALETACKQAKAWQNAGYPPFRVAVNLSGIQFRQSGLDRLTAKILADVELDPKYLELELTESIAMGEVNRTLHKLNALSDLGLKLAIDDFGTGFSSLSYLRRFPIHTLKIDRSFVLSCTNDAEDAAIIRAIIRLAHSLGLRVIAEGVETKEQERFLRQEQCDEVQGYFYSTPLPIQRLIDFFHQRGLKPKPTSEQTSSKDQVIL